ncbi:MAG: RsmF rRNA methyltransferase first C-terminal domain-containing protein [Erysipelotrichaceae bacterium]|nr:RsmF rRNA methyltransferase first C-terminal domain-containing protein [Erysipelotrichaceae bacterium]
MNDYFYQQTKAYFKEKQSDYLEKLKEPCTQGFFLNTLKAKKEDILDLIDFPCKKSSYDNNSYYHDHSNIGKTIVNDLGLIYPQEVAASLPASYPDLAEVKLIVDLCAAPGGKSIDILNRAKEESLLIANDISHERALVISQNFERLGISNAIITSKDTDRLSEQLEGQADLVILDAPCSGEGMIRKYPEIMDMLTESYTKELAELQKKLLDAAYRTLKPGGQLLYSTCTYSFLEDEEQVKNYLERYPTMKLIPIKQESYSDYPGTVKLCPLNETEGQFFALFQKDSDAETSYSRLHNLKPVKQKTVDTFIQENLDIREYYLYLYNGHYYMSQIPLYDLDNGILRYGIYLGDMTKDRFEPSHHLYRSNLLKGCYRHVYDLNEEEMRSYLEGRELKTELPDHYYQITYKDYSLGYGKCAKGIMKNKYPKGLRRML